jgi:type VI secretion system protein ImpF
MRSVAGDQQESGLRASLIDRLIDPDAEGTRWRRGYSVEQMIETVRRDVEDLLNSHRMSDVIAEEFPEVRNSIVTFGMPDLVSTQSSMGHAMAKVGAALEEAINRFEPRLVNVRAIPLAGQDPRKLRLEFQIQAMLRMDPSPEVSFVTLLKLTTGEASIQQGSG